MIWMDTIFKLTFSVNYKSYLPLLNTKKLNFLKMCMATYEFYAPNYKEHVKEYFEPKGFFQKR